MSQSKKRKKHVPSRKPPRSYLDISKHYFNEYVRVAHQLMLMAGLDPREFDLLTKRTKQELMMIKQTPYNIVAEKGSKVPRAYIKFFNHLMGIYEKTTYYGDPKFNVTYLDYVTYGLCFVFAVRNHDSNDDILSDDQHERLETIREALQKYMDDNEKDHYLVRTNELMRVLSMYVSMPNYRYYTSIEKGEMDYLKCRVQNRIRVSSFEPEKRYFKVKGEKHSSYQLWHHKVISDINDPNPEKTEIPAVLMEEDDFNTALKKIREMETIVKLPVYVQNHALHRIRQRLDCVDNLYVNTVFGLSFMLPKFITATNGQRMIRAIDMSGKPVGYFPFLKQDGAILLLSFLPLSSPITPEGSVLYKELGIKIDDSKYIGLDKLSFYIKTDFEVLPKLKQALQKADMWHLTELQPSEKLERSEDQILKRFFSINTSDIEIE
ncbi:MAG: hypothetical protein PHR83_18510 [Paludibacter sp.]|nr:hypothetical protein [Paludibacter sp.]